MTGDIAATISKAREHSIGDLLRRSAQREPNKPALAEHVVCHGSGRINEELVLEEVVSIRPEADGFLLVSLYGERRQVRAQIREIDLLNQVSKAFLRTNGYSLVSSLGVSLQEGGAGGFIGPVERSAGVRTDKQRAPGSHHPLRYCTDYRDQFGSPRYIRGFLLEARGYRELLDLHPLPASS